MIKNTIYISDFFNHKFDFYEKHAVCVLNFFNDIHLKNFVLVRKVKMI